VWRALDTVLGVERALKLLDDEAARSPVFRSRFLTEARVMARLDHPNILRVFDYGHENGRFFLVMELLDGGSVAELLRATRPLPMGKALHIIFDVLKALTAVHASGTVHRDVKPGNILLGGDGGARLSDFGIVHIPDQKLLHQTGMGDTMGTIGYMAPEQRSDARLVTPRSDLFGVGATLFAMVSRRHPSVLQAVDKRPEYLAEISDPVAGIIRKATRTNPEERSRDAKAMAHEVVRAYDALVEHEAGPCEEQWMQDLERALDKAMANLAALSTRPPPPPRHRTPTSERPSVRRPLPDPRLWSQTSTVQMLTIVFGITSTLIAFVVIVILFMR
jgi:serine/threonine-protein kinase